MIQCTTIPWDQTASDRFTIFSFHVRCAKPRAPIFSTVSKDALDEWEQSPRPAQQLNRSITVLNIGRMNDDIQQETQRVDQDVPLATLDLLARVIARRIEPRPPF
jgi:hypothetical protein